LLFVYPLCTPRQSTLRVLTLSIFAASDWEVCKFADLSLGRCVGMFASFAATIARCDSVKNDTLRLRAI